MWLKAFESDGKILSESEFWILSLVRDDFESPNAIMDRLTDSTQEWTPKPGTVYPILHRLTEAHLLDRIEDGSLSFKRSEVGKLFLSSISKPLRTQLKETLNYYNNILGNLADFDPIPARYEDLLRDLSGSLISFAKKVEDLADVVQVRAEKVHNVSITFEN